jgi:hypothetical protein
MVAVSAPAHATLQIAASVNGGPSFVCVDNTIACDLDPTIGSIMQIPTTIIDGVSFTGGLDAFSVKGPDFLTGPSISTTNNSGAPVTVELTVSDTSFQEPVILAETSASGTFVSSAPSITTSWWVDTANAQGAKFAGDTPGTMVDTFSSPGNPSGSYSHNTDFPFGATSPFSVTIDETFTLAAGGRLVNREQAEFRPPVIPEPSTWAMMGVGVAFLGYAGYRGRRSAVAAAL